MSGIDIHDPTQNGRHALVTSRYSFWGDANIVIPGSVFLGATGSASLIPHRAGERRYRQYRTLEELLPIIIFMVICSYTVCDYRVVHPPGSDECEY
ncbi:hypothetical protein NDU88_006073 [Pleurodeles waltl]|uniref:Uncharacterized protein n=1 Tax=Pleurodeles waltl TaxID=8319 RepID=A0AAV7LPK6_PLEWA|nr:hypothetical protein NDU88_006073 [Pleurodeles waltl]